MSAAALSIIARLQAAGATLECKDGGRVRFSAPVPLPATLLAEARELPRGHRRGTDGKHSASGKSYRT